MRRALGLELPSALCLTRQKVPFLKLPRDKVALAVKGAYIVRDVPAFDLIIIATGSEVSLALAAADQLKNFKVRVVSMPCWELFAEQPDAYRNEVLPKNITKRVSIEAGTTLGWERYVGNRGLVIGIDHYGASAPAEVLAETYGFTVEKVVQRISQCPFA